MTLEEERGWLQNVIALKSQIPVGDIVSASLNEWVDLMTTVMERGPNHENARGALEHFKDRILKNKQTKIKKNNKTTNDQIDVFEAFIAVKSRQFFTNPSSSYFFVLHILNWGKKKEEEINQLEKKLDICAAAFETSEWIGDHDPNPIYDCTPPAFKRIKIESEGQNGYFCEEIELQGSSSQINASAVKDEPLDDIDHFPATPSYSNLGNYEDFTDNSMGNPSTFAMTTDVPGTSKNTGHIQDPRENHPPERNALTVAQCPKCGEHFWNRRVLRRHVCDGKPVQPTAATTTTTAVDPPQQRRLHCPKTKLSCGLCGAAYWQERSLRAHVSRCTAEFSAKAEAAAQQRAEQHAALFVRHEQLRKEAAADAATGILAARRRSLREYTESSTMAAAAQFEEKL